MQVDESHVFKYSFARDINRKPALSRGLGFVNCYEGKEDLQTTLLSGLNMLWRKS